MGPLPVGFHNIVVVVDLRCHGLVGGGHAARWYSLIRRVPELVWST
jgi:hypothetical protein